MTEMKVGPWPMRLRALPYGRLASPPSLALSSSTGTGLQATLACLRGRARCRPTTSSKPHRNHAKRAPHDIGQSDSKTSADPKRILGEPSADKMG